jgi:hypothetical protein
VNATLPLFEVAPYDRRRREYGPFLTVECNRKGVMDIDTVKGCAHGMAAHPDGGCYGECYANKTAHRYGIDFSKAVTRRIHTRDHLGTICRFMAQSGKNWYRVGTAGDPAHDWHNTVVVLNALRGMNMRPVIVSKMWESPTDEQLGKLRKLGAVFNISVSALDSAAELQLRLGARERLIDAGLTVCMRVVTCDFGTSEWALSKSEVQRTLLALTPVIDNPLRPTLKNPLVHGGEIKVTRRNESIGGGSKYVSLHRDDVYLGTCCKCPDQCGAGEGSEAWKKRASCGQTAFSLSTCR